MKKVSIVILNWNGKALLEKFLPSVIENSPSDWAEIIVADNGSTDDSIVMLQNKFPTVRLILLDTNYGFAEGYNRALQLIDTPYAVLLNSDVEVTPNWLEAPISLLDTDLSLTCVQPKILAEQNKGFFEYAGASGGYLDKYGYPFCRGRILHVVEKDFGQYDESTDILWASGACLFIRTNIYKQEGGLDATFFAHQEEIDMCWRLRCRGYRIVCTPQSVVYHVGGATLHVESPHKTFLNFRNNLLMLYKNLPENELKKILFIRFWLDYIAAFKFLITGHPRNANAVYKARKDFRKLKAPYLSIRHENLKKTTLPFIPELFKSSILLNFYFRGKKRFSDLKQYSGSNK